MCAGTRGASWEDKSSYRKESREATKDATPQTITVAFVRLEPVPPPDPPPGMLKVYLALSEWQGSSARLSRLNSHTRDKEP